MASTVWFSPSAEATLPRTDDHALHVVAPDLSAYKLRLSPAQSMFLIPIIVGTVIGLMFDVQATIAAWCGLATIAFALTTLHRLRLLWQAVLHPLAASENGAALATRDAELPTYALLIALHNEKAVTVEGLVDALSQLDYPAAKLDGLLLLEQDDGSTIAAVRDVNAPPWLRILTVPPGGPRTKPNALSFGLSMTDAELVAVFDAEDRPDPDQLRKAVGAFANDPGMHCLQARLRYYNSSQNTLTRWFSLEYTTWFTYVLPGLYLRNAPIPLGGTSNHFRSTVLRAVLGWDPYNVTEDADLGIRLARFGYRVGPLDSYTAEEATSSVRNWTRQRSRWIKGYMQTLVVHTRTPRVLAKQLGCRRAWSIVSVLGGSLVSVLGYPLFLSLLVAWVVAQPHWIAMAFTGPLYYLALTTFAIGTCIFLYIAVLVSADEDPRRFGVFVLGMPIYWILMGVAGYLALAELFLRPHYWYKTEHGAHVTSVDRVIEPGRDPVYATVRFGRNE